MPEDPNPSAHAWYTTDAGTRVPALLTEWRQTPAGWEARITYATLVRAGHWGTITEWVPSAQVEQA